MPAPDHRARARLWVVLASVAVALGVAASAGRQLLLDAAAARLRRAGAERGLTVSWRSLALRSPAALEVRGLTMTSQVGDTVMRADSLRVDVDPGSAITLHPRPTRIALVGSRIVRPRRPAIEPDTLLEDPAPQTEATAGRIRHLADELSRAMLVPARELPELSLRDVTIEAASSDESALHGATLERLDLTHPGGGVRLNAAGHLALERELPFTVELEWRTSDRIRGLVGVPDTVRGEVDTLRLTLDGAVHQERDARRVTIVDGTRLTLGRMRFALGGRVEAAGPHAHFTVDALGLDSPSILASVPPPVLGPLRDLAVRGSFDWHLGLDLDLARPDSVQLDADVVPHDLALDPGHTELRILGLEGPFTATIHLPHGRTTTRELSPANPFYRPIEAMDSTLVHAVLTNEDGGFFRHRGFSLEAVRLAIAANLKAGAYRRGAGTVTMQLARNLWLGHERTLSRKLQEVVLAWVLEHLTGLSKQRLLEIYLNIIEWGPEVHGAGEGARFYFDQDPGHLTVPEALFLTIVVPSPSRWRGRFDRDGVLRPWARAQMHFIGRAMIAKGWLAPDQLPPVESLNVELRGPAHDGFRPDSATVEAGRIGRSGNFAQPASVPGR